MAGLLAGDINCWVRQGRGHVLQFYADDEEVAKVLTESLLPAYGPYLLAGSVMVPVGGGKYVQYPVLSH